MYDEICYGEHAATQPCPNPTWSHEGWVCAFHQLNHLIADIEWFLKVSTRPQ